MKEHAFFSTLKGRAKLTVNGPDRKDFLQNLITNDLQQLDHQSCVYACLLTPQGKFLYDFFVTKDENAIILDCEGGERAQDLLKILSMYKLRADVDIHIDDNIDIYAIFGADHGTKDPRHTEIGFRSYTKPQEIQERPFEEWDYKRIQLTIPDGSRDLIPQKSTMDEAHMDQLNAISYDKGCYLGQELTARMHYRGLGKKHLKTVPLNALPDGAELRSSCKDLAIALVKD